MCVFRCAAGGDAVFLQRPGLLRELHHQRTLRLQDQSLGRQVTPPQPTPLSTLCRLFLWQPCLPLLPSNSTACILRQQMIDKPAVQSPPSSIIPAAAAENIDRNDQRQNAAMTSSSLPSLIGSLRCHIVDDRRRVDKTSEGFCPIRACDVMIQNGCQSGSRHESRKDAVSECVRRNPV